MAPRANSPALNPKMVAEKQRQRARQIPVKYTVREGDKWTTIAERLYGDFFGGDRLQAQRMFEQLARANPGIMNLRPGVVLRIPSPSRNPYVSPGAFQPQAAAAPLARPVAPAKVAAAPLMTPQASPTGMASINQMPTLGTTQSANAVNWGSFYGQGGMPTIKGSTGVKPPSTIGPSTRPKPSYSPKSPGMQANTWGNYYAQGVAPRVNARPRNPVYLPFTQNKPAPSGATYWSPAAGAYRPIQEMYGGINPNELPEGIPITAPNMLPDTWLNGIQRNATGIAAQLASDRPPTIIGATEAFTLGLSPDWLQQAGYTQIGTSWVLTEDTSKPTGGGFKHAGGGYGRGGYGGGGGGGYGGGYRPDYSSTGRQFDLPIAFGLVSWRI